MGNVIMDAVLETEASTILERLTARSSLGG